MYSIEEYSSKIKRATSTIRGWLDQGLLERKWELGRLYFTDDDVVVGEQIKKNKHNNLRKIKNES